MICLNLYLPRLLSVQINLLWLYFQSQKVYPKNYRIKYLNIILKKVLCIHFSHTYCMYTNDDNWHASLKKSTLLDGAFESFNLINERTTIWEYLHQVYLGSGSIYFVWGKHPLTGHVVQDCVLPIYPVSFNPSFQWRQHNTRQHKHVSYIDIQCLAR